MGQNRIVVYKPKRGKYLGYKKEDYGEGHLREFVDDVLGGNGEY
jgi:hypothetical protein